jgi:gluconate 5-dehydrogenase
LPGTNLVPPAPPHASIPVELPESFSTAGSLKERRALVTGGGRGLGLAIAAAFAEAGAQVAISGRHPEFLEAGLAELRQRGCEGVAIEADVADASSSRAMVAEAARRLGGLDVLVNNAGSGARKPPEELTEEEYDRIFDTNVKGLYCEAARLMATGGSIVNLASVVSVLADIELAAYCASKGAVLQLTRVLAAAWGERGIRVNAVAPGYTDSPLNAHRKADPAKTEAVVGRTPLGRWGKPADVAAAAVFLASDAASFITGQTLFVEGGFMLAR